MITRLRPATRVDQPLLAEATLGNLNWKGPRFTMNQVRENPALWHYIEPWPGPHDFGFVAEDETRAVIGVVWLKHFSASDPGYGFIDPTIPELIVHVAASHRGRGVGGRLITTAIDEARDQGLTGVSLSVEDGNPAVRLYSRLGFLPAGPGYPGTYLLTLTPMERPLT